VLYVPDNINKRNAIETAKSIATYGSGAAAALIYAGVK
jgi:hypothetical protein